MNVPDPWRKEWGRAFLVGFVSLAFFLGWGEFLQVQPVRQPSGLPRIGPAPAALADPAHSTSPPQPDPGSLAPLESTPSPPGSPASALDPESGSRAGRDILEMAEFAEFDRWLGRYQAAPSASEREGWQREGERLALRRRERLYELIATDPERALAWAIPMAQRRELPVAVQGLLEERVSGHGEYTVAVADDFPQQRQEVRREVRLDGRKYEAHVYGRRLDQGTRRGVPLWGIAVSRGGVARLALHPDPVRRLASGEGPVRSAGQERCPISGRVTTGLETEVLGEVAGQVEHFCGAAHLLAWNERLLLEEGGGLGPFAAASTDGAGHPWTQGRKTLLFMRVVFPDDPTEPITEDGAYALLDGVNQWYTEASYGTTSLIPAVTPLLLLPQPKAYYSNEGTTALLADARDAARRAGYDTDNYDWDMVRHTVVPGANFSWTGLGQVHGKGVWLQSSALNVACHELGHNYGLWHANLWSAIGDSVIGPGANLEYGNIFDTMSTVGAGNLQFNAAFKHQIEWLPDSCVHFIETSGVYRVYAYDVPQLVDGLKYALRVRKNYGRNYWAEYRQRITANPWLQSGVLLNWDPWNNGVANSAGGTQLLDTTPGTQTGNAGRDDAALTLGRTFADAAAGVYLTPLAKGSGDGGKWIEVAVQLGSSPDNHPPLLTLTADRLVAGVNVAVHFDAAASDADGDAVAYAWDFGDDTFGPNAAAVTKAWTGAGEFTVRCTVSDLRGGTYSQRIVVTVGTPLAYRVSGRVITADGSPLEGVRVHNGLSGAAYRGTYSDSDGDYTLANLPPGTVTLAGVKYGYKFLHGGWTNPLAIGPGGEGIDWVGIPDPVIRLTALTSTLSEEDPVPGRIRVARSGSTNAALTVRFNRTGSAVADMDYTMSPALTNSPLQLVIPAGALFVDIAVSPLPDALVEGPEQLVLTAIEDSAYVLGDRAEASLRIEDAASGPKPMVWVAALGGAGSANPFSLEGSLGGAVFRFTRSGDPDTELLVRYAVSGSATPDADYRALPGLVAIPAGAASATVPVAVLDDVEAEPDETVRVTLLADPSYDGAGGSATITLLDDDPPGVFVTATDAQAGGGGGNAGTFTVTRLGDVGANLLVSYQLSGTATKAVDYAELSGLVLIPAGQATANVEINPLVGGAGRGPLTVVATLQSSAAYNVQSPSQATVVIRDQAQPIVTLSVTDATAFEAGTKAGRFTFARSGSTQDPLTVYYQVGGTALNGVDYEWIESTVVIPAGSSTGDVVITPVDDSIREVDEKVILLLAPALSYTRGTTAAQSVLIKDDDLGLPAVGFSLAAWSGPEGVGVARLSVTLSAASAATVTVHYSASGGTATPGMDYLLTPGVVTFAPGVVSQSFPLYVLDDPWVEGDETVVISLSNPAGAVLDALGTHTYTILDDDASGSITVVAVQPVAAEAGLVPGAFRITRAGGTNSDQAVQFQVTGTASSLADYVPLPASIVIPAGAAFVDLPVVPVEDATVESEETVVLSLTSAPHARLGSPATAVVVLRDTDSDGLRPIVSVELWNGIALESGSAPIVFRIRRAGATNEALTVEFTLTGTARAGTDYEPTGASAVIPAGADAALVPVLPRDDVLFEGDETLVLTLTLRPEYRVGFPASAAGVLQDDENGVFVTTEGASVEDGSDLGSFVITRTGGIMSDMEVHFSTGGTAEFEDYAPLGESVTIPAGASQVRLPVIPRNDSVPEVNKTVVLTLLGGAGYTVVSPTNATLTMLDDEPGISVVARDPIAYEGGGNPGLFTISRTGNIDEDVTVFFAVTGTASNGTDYAAIPDFVVIPAGERSIDVPILPLNDDEVEGNETVQLMLQENLAYSLRLPSSAVVTLLDDELNLVPFAEIVSPAVRTVYLANTNNALVLEAEAADDGRPDPPGSLTLSWTMVSGPSAVVFSHPDEGNTTARFGGNGIFVLRFAASDGQLTAAEDRVVVVGPELLLGLGLRAYWKFDESEGSIAADSSGNGRTAALTGARLGPGRFDQGLHLDGVDDVATFPSMSLTQLTVTAWVRSESPGDSTTPRILAMPGFNVRVRRDANAASTNSLALVSERSSVSGEWRSPANVIADGTWAHVAVTYDSARTTNTPQFFINGELRSATRRTAPAGTPLNNSGPGSIGNSAALDRSWDGDIDEVRIYDRMLSALEVQVIASGPVTNLAPQVNAGFAQFVEFGSGAALHGQVQDDGEPQPPASVHLRWSKVSGPGNVTFADPELAETHATFSDGGSYVLRLTANDGQVKTVADVRITVSAPPRISIQAVDRTATEFGPTAGMFTVRREQADPHPLIVRLLVAGTAINGLDYEMIPETVTIPADAFSVSFFVIPRPDELAEGEETIRIEIGPSGSYVAGGLIADTVFLEDAPWDAWRFEHFSAGELDVPGISGPEADPDGDGLSNLLEYALDLDPRSPTGGPVLRGTLEDLPGVPPILRGYVVQYRRRLAPVDVSYVLEVAGTLDPLAWTSGSGVSRELAPVIPDEGGLTETVRVLILPGEAERRFVRLKVTLER